MRRLLSGALLFVMCLMGADVSGKWSGTFTPDGGDANPHPVFLILTQDGDKLTGSGGPNESEQHPMRNGKVVGDRITFEVPADNGVFMFDLKVAGDELTGDLQFKGDNETRTAKVAMKRPTA